MTTISNVQQQPSANFCHMPLQANQRIKNNQYHFNWSKGNCLIKHDPTLPSSPVHFQPLVLLELTVNLVTGYDHYVYVHGDRKRHNQRHLHRGKKQLHLRTAPERQTDKKERNTVALATILFMSLTSSLSPGPSSTLLCRLFFFSFVSPSISHTMHRLSGCQNCKGAQYLQHAQNIFFLYQSIVIFVPFYPEPHSLSCCLVVLIYSYLLFYTAFTICFVFQLLICKGICNSKLVCIFFFCGTQNKIFW